MRYLQEDRLFLLRDYDLITEQVEVNIIISEATKKALDLDVVTKGEYVSMSMNLNKWKQYLKGELNPILGLNETTGNATISNSVFLQVFKYGNNKRNLWDQVKKAKPKELEKLIADNDLRCGEKNTTQECKKYLAKDWGMVQFIIPGQNCSTVEFESLSRFWFLKSLDLINT